MYAALTNRKTRFQAIGADFYDRPQSWQKRTCTELIQLLPDYVAAFAHYLVSRNNTSYKLVMAFLFIRSMDEYGTIYLSNLKQMFYNFYRKRFINPLYQWPSLPVFRINVPWMQCFVLSQSSDIW